MELVRRSCKIEALLLIPSEGADEAVWEDHVAKVGDFIGDIPWEGDTVGITLHQEGWEPLEADEGMYLIKETWRNGDVEFFAVTEDEFLAKYEVA